MENIIFLIFIIVMFVLQTLGQARRKREIPSPRGEKPSQRQPTLEDILKTLGFPPMEQPQPEEEPIEVVIEEEREEKPRVEKIEVAEEKELVPVLEKIPEKEALPLDKLEEAIIYSTIIGPPKAYQIRRGVGIGIRSSLKNW